MAHLAASQRFRPQFEAWLAQSGRGAVQRAQIEQERKGVNRIKTIKQHQASLYKFGKTFFTKMQEN